ncbi:4-diphosphocytidyl-2-C-methyl-D-erythritol kinase [Candidatus Protochlamydia naegleriophila]|uniref:4-diphosphocytidyl-2-C-methyl-D-erythritol kinase n=1 Tax=Candidatus Protochlamydia naegleriophila TaxID=389348 RepID=A0A0U5JDJ6_9BACT|nr:4-(cytidine 5'-diphospho)-2-C-methyl-D-erythritol kinase [Candidatus Protochlamydia naegleriophila]CUI17181.1 4-diphosphocytidyl-2-C-methyl-D-erythritol kinase [Candidatus Protochlamydia naegleriophila]
MLRLFSPAKVNLFLRVVSKRSDGYHELSSVFQTISLGDVLTFQRQVKDVLTCSDPLLPTDSSNLVLKATQLFRSKTGIDLHLRVHLDKRVPSQAGLGGGSSNAATTLWACNQLAGGVASTDELMQWSGEIGSDIPFFFSNGTAHCTGRGEVVQDLPPTANQKLWIVKPALGLSTPEVYGRVRISQTSQEAYSNLDKEKFLQGTLPYFNDLESAAFEACPELKEIKAFLSQSGFETVLMSGSGSSFFCMGEGHLPHQTSLRAFSAHFINRSPIQWYA